MSFNKLSGIPEQPAKADKSAVCTNKSAPTGIRGICLKPIIGGNRHQPNEKPINLRRGEGGGAGKGGPLWSPASCSLCSPVGGTRSHRHHRATIKALPTPTQPPSPLQIIRPPVSLPGLG